MTFLVRLSQSPADDATIHVEGDIDLATTGELLDRVRALLPSTNSAVRLDCRAVTFTDSSGLHALCILNRELATDDRSLVIVEPSQPLRRVLDLAGLSSTFTIE